MDYNHNKESTHKIFVDSVDEVVNFNPVEYFETEENLLGNKTNRMKKSQLEKVKVCKCYKILAKCKRARN